MASSSSDESSRAPENFQISSASNDEDDVVELKGKSSKKLKRRLKTDDLDNATKPSQKCLVCLTQQHRFHCRDCVKSGYITHTGQTLGER